MKAPIHPIIEEYVADPERAKSFGTMMSNAKKTGAKREFSFKGKKYVLKRVHRLIKPTDE